MLDLESVFGFVVVLCACACIGSCTVKYVRADLAETKCAHGYPK
jgi:hypothetical protein